MDLFRKKFQSVYDAKNKIWHGIRTEPNYGPQDSVGAVALQKLLQEPNKINQICFPNGKKYTNLEIAQWSVNVAERFKSLNVEQCDVIGLCVSNTDYLSLLFFGALLSGLTLSTLDPSFDKDGLTHIYSITKPKVMFCDGNICDKVKEALNEINLDITIYTMNDHIPGVPTINEFLENNVDVHTYRPEPLKLGYNQTAAIMCSSGTTGKPKGVCTAHSVLMNAAVDQLHDSDIILSFSNIFWISGVWSLVVGTICGATRIISNRPFSTDDFLELVQKYKVTVLFSTPSVIAMALASPKLKEYDLSSVLRYLLTGAVIQLSLVEKFQPHIPKAAVICVYGMTETGGPITIGISAPDGSTGKLIPNSSMKIINDDGVQLGPEETGEICIKSLYSWAGYYGNEQATKDVYIDGWVHSGDLGYVDKEGKLFIIDRKKNIVKPYGFHVFPTEIEEIISHLPSVLEVCVCGISDAVSQCILVAAIVRTPESTLTEDEVCNYVANNTMKFKHLRGGVYFLDRLPKTVSGKVLRREVQTVLEKLASTPDKKTVNILSSIL